MGAMVRKGFLSGQYGPSDKSVVQKVRAQGGGKPQWARCGAKGRRKLPFNAWGEKRIRINSSSNSVTFTRTTINYYRPIHQIRLSC